MCGSLHCRFGVWQKQIKRHKLLISATFDCMRAPVLIAQKVLQRYEQERSQPSLFLISATQRITFKQMREESLHEILGVGRRVPSVANECVERRQVRFTKSGERFPCGFVGVRITGSQYYGPMRRLEWRASFLQRSWNRFRNSAQYCRSKLLLLQKSGIPSRDALPSTRTGCRIRRCTCRNQSILKARRPHICSIEHIES